MDVVLVRPDDVSGRLTVEISDLTHRQVHSSSGAAAGSCN
jgi:hypothetical protein